MKPRMRQRGFSLTEVLMAAGILMLGFLLIAGTFPVGIKLTALATERTIGLVAAKEATAKISLYGVNLQRVSAELTPFDAWSVDPNSLIELRPSGMNDTDFYTLTSAYMDQQGIYPSSPYAEEQRYYWTGLYRGMQFPSPHDLQVIIFVGRRTGGAVRYPRYTDPMHRGIWTASEWPVPVPIQVQRTAADVQQDDADGWDGGFHNEMRIVGTFNFDDGTDAAIMNTVAQYVKEGASIVDGSTGQVMRVLEVENLTPTAAVPEWVIRLVPLSNYTTTLSDDGLFEWGNTTGVGNSLPEPRTIWVMPPAIMDTDSFDPEGDGDDVPPVVAGRDPCVSVYQTVLSF
ncbi:MAG: prepilin-type N-terminal cleavage/methylation domain-containing protein [Sedimentisphaerales bacterium]|nr:prepilin-type N-terminal cleavage/methylation domain-containing protein [Sedimentisphaerales bacterium]